MKSHMFVLFATIFLLPKVILVEGEEATTVAGVEASPLNSKATDSSASVPPSLHAADAAGPPQREKEDGFSSSTTYIEITLDGKCNRYYNADITTDNIVLDGPPYITGPIRAYPCGFRSLSGGSIAGIVIAVFILLAAVGVGICCCLKKNKRLAVHPFGPAAASSAYSNQPPAAPYAYGNQPPAAPPAYANQPPTSPPAYSNQPPTAPYGNQPPAGPPAYSNQPPAAAPNV